MSISIIAFGLVALVSILILTVTMTAECDLKLAPLKQTGDSSLSPGSVNWLGGIAFSAAVLICLF